jgi:hypothetical protein
MLKVQYFKNPNIARHIYNRFLAAYVKFPWNDVVPHYFDRIVYGDFFMGMHRYYTILPSSYYGDGKGRTYDRKMGISKCSIAKAFVTFGIFSNIGILLTFIDVSYIRCWQGGQECNQRKFRIIFLWC